MRTREPLDEARRLANLNYSRERQNHLQAPTEEALPGLTLT